MDRRLVLILFTMLTNTATSSSIEKHILDSATKPEMFDLFHVMPDGEMKVIHELDMLLTIDQYRTLYRDDSENDPESRDKESEKRYKRKAARQISLRWRNCRVYYEITESLDTRRDRAIIKEAIDEWEKYTCLDFIENPRARRRIQFKDGEMCASPVGMQKTAQSLELASGCRTKGIIAHEIGHAVGWFHEHMRPDRDDYLNVHLSAIPTKYRRSYRKYSTDVVNTYGVPYDYSSIMHYGETVFPGSMVARDPRFQSKLGQRVGFSFKDIKLANVMYDCAKVMKCPPRNCGDGFQLYKAFKGVKACQCWCDSGNLTDPLVLCSRRKRPPLPPVPTLPAPTSEPTMGCMDVRQDCKLLKDQKKCMTKMAMMMANCAKTCGFCGKGKDLCMDYESGCGVMAGHCEDIGLRSTMSEICMASCDLCPSPPDPCEAHKEMMGDFALSKGASALKNSNGVRQMLVYSCVLLVSSVVVARVGG